MSVSACDGLGTRAGLETRESPTCTTHAKSWERKRLGHRVVAHAPIVRLASDRPDACASPPAPISPQNVYTRGPFLVPTYPPSFITWITSQVAIFGPFGRYPKATNAPRCFL